MCYDYAQLLAALHVIIRAWESLQVELCGQYSLASLDELAMFMGRTGRLRAVAIAVLTPFTCVATIILVDALPLRPPTKSVLDQSASYWVRLFFTLTVSSAMVTLFIQHASSKLHIKRRQFIAMVAFVTLATMFVDFLLHLLIGFPTPFIIQLSTPPWQGFLLSSMWAIWKNTIRTDTEVQRDLTQFRWLILSQFVMAVMYPVMIYAFDTLNGVQQTIFSIAFPVVKLLVKNLASRGVYRREDLAPVYIVLSVDVFHALLLSCAMRAATSRWTVISVMATDVFQSVVAVVEVRAITKRLDRLRVEISTPSSKCLHLHGRKTNVVAFAQSILASHPQIRSDPSIAFSRHLRLSSLPVQQAMPPPGPLNRIFPTAMDVAPVPHDVNAQVKTCDECALHVEYVRLSLQLLHMVEFYVLIEFTEAMVACIYGTV
jgi:hypothetical protein